MAVPQNKTLYDKAKKMADKKFDKPSAYKSAYIQRQYKSMGGKYKGKKKNNLSKAIKSFRK